MAGRFIDAFARSMGWTVRNDMAFGTWRGYLFTVRDYGDYTNTTIWLYTQGTIATIKTEEYFIQTRNKYHIVRVPLSTRTGMEIIQHLASTEEVKGMIQTLTEWLMTAGAKSGCPRCGRLDENALSLMAGAPVYICPECGENTAQATTLGFDISAARGDKKADPNRPAGIGGWLLVFLAGRILGIILLLVGIINAAHSYNLPNIVQTGQGHLLTIAILLNCIGIVFEISILIFFLMKKMIFRTLFTIYMIYSLATAICIPTMASNATAGIPAGATQLLSFLSIVIWMIYLFASKRVKHTFHRYAKKGRNYKIKPDRTTPSKEDH